MTARVRLSVDLVVGAALFATMAVAGTTYVRVAIAAGARPEFYQNEFGPAVMLACGRGYVAPARGIPALEDFLELRRDRLSCDELPLAIDLAPLSGPQATWKYLLGTAAIYWRVAGVSWSGLVPMSGTFYGLCAVLIYVLCRLVANVFFAAVAAVGAITSPLHLTELPHLRDYSKAPFILALLLILAVMVTSSGLRRRLWWCAATFGAVLGIGIGFRNDLLIVIPAFVLVVVALPAGVDAVKTRLVALALAAAVFTLAASPLLGAYGSGGGAGMQHVALLGLTTPFDGSLGVATDGTYEFGYQYNDSYVAAIVTDYAVRRQGVVGPIAPYDAHYDAAGTGLIREVFRLLPGDLLTRGYAAALGIMTLPASSLVDSTRLPFVDAGLVVRAYDARARYIRATPWIWVAAVPLALLVGASYDLRRALVVAAVLLYLAAYPAIQFHERHFFHLNFFGWTALAYLGERVIQCLRPGAIRTVTRTSAIACAVRATAFVGILAVGMVAPLMAFRDYQDGAVRAALADRLAAPRSVVATRPAPASPGRIVLEPAEVLPAEERLAGRTGIVTSELLFIDIPRDLCPFTLVDLTLRYSTPVPTWDFSRRMAVSVGAEPGTTTTVMAPVFFAAGTIANQAVPGPRYRFRGLEIPEGQERCVGTVSRVNDPGQFSLLLGGLLPPSWRGMMMHQTIAAIETRPLPRDPHIYTVPPSTPVPWAALSAPLLVPTDADVKARAPVLKMPTPGQWTMDGVGGLGGVGPFLYLMELKPRPLVAGEEFVVEGRLTVGGLMFGILRDGNWLVETEVLHPGPFVVVLTAPTAGDGAGVIANYLTGSSLRNTFDITRAGWRRPQ